ncbi:uncharacterized protein ACIB01_006123 [Guaruba guarouba]
MLVETKTGISSRLQVALAAHLRNRFKGEIPGLEEKQPCSEARTATPGGGTAPRRLVRAKMPLAVCVPFSHCFLLKPSESLLQPQDSYHVSTIWQYRGSAFRIPENLQSSKDRTSDLLVSFSAMEL